MTATERRRLVTAHQDATGDVAVEVWQDELGLMPPPYNLGITLVVNNTEPREVLKQSLVNKIFVDLVDDPNTPDTKTTRAKLALQHQLRIIEAGVKVGGTSDITVAQLRQLIRYTMVDHLSDASFVGVE